MPRSSPAAPDDSSASSSSRMRGSLVLPVALPALLGGEIFLRRTAGAGHRDVALRHELTGVGAAVLVGLRAASRVTLDVERVRVPLLLRRPLVLVIGPRPLAAGALAQLLVIGHGCIVA